MMGLIIALVIAVSGGVSVAAETSVPGDMLYSVKTSVNEQVRGMIATSAEAEAEWEVRLAERRLEEAAKLDARGDLAPGIATKLNAEFATHAEAALSAAGHADIADRITLRLQEVAEKHVALFADAEIGDMDRDGSADVSARSFVLPHVLEATFEYDVKSPRDVATGQSSGRVMTGDVDGDGSADATADTDDDGDAAMRGGVKSETKADGGSAEVEGSIEVKLGE